MVDDSPIAPKGQRHEEAKQSSANGRDQTNGASRVAHKPIVTEATPVDFHKTFQDTPLPPTALLPGILPYDVWGLAAAGATRKTTVVLWIMVHLVLGWPCLGREFDKARPALLISGEDDMKTLRYRIRRICDALALRDAERETVGADLHIEDVSDKVFRLVEPDLTGSLRFTEHIDDVINAYKGKKPGLVVIDPLNFAGPGERYTNDGEAAMMQAGRRLSRALGGCSVGFLHHTGKKNAEDQKVDQYAGRGGSAFADNARAILTMTWHEKDTDQWPRPTAVTPEDVEAGRVLRLHVAKFSHDERERRPLWIVRDRDDGYSFAYHQSKAPTSAEKKAERDRARLEVAYMVACDAHDYLTRCPDDHYPGWTQVKEAVEVKINGKLLGVNRVRAMLDICVQKGVITVQPPPQTAGKTGQKEYLAAGRKPDDVGWS